MELFSDGSFSYEYGGDSSLEGPWDCSGDLLRIFNLIDEEIYRSYLLDYELCSETELYIDGREWPITGEYRKTHTLTISIEDKDGGENDGATVYVEVGIGEGYDCSDSALLSGGTAEIFFPAVEEKEYLLLASIDEDGNGSMGINEYRYNSGWITIDDDTTVAIEAEDWYLLPQ